MLVRCKDPNETGWAHSNGSPVNRIVVTLRDMSGIMSRWPVLLEHGVTPDDVDTSGRIRGEVLEGWVVAARSAYLDRCVLLNQMLQRSGLHLRYGARALPRGDLLGRPTSVVISAGATEFLPETFTISVRLRPVGGDREIPLNIACAVQLEDPATGEIRPLTNDIRDELIALAHGAEHFN
jgi:hypothetical protein